LSSKATQTNPVKSLQKQTLALKWYVKVSQGHTIYGYLKADKVGLLYAVV